MSESYSEDLNWQRVEKQTFDDEGQPQFEFQSCSIDECEGDYWSDGSDKVCDVCGHSPDGNGPSSSGSHLHSPYPLKGESHPLTTSKGDRIRYEYSRQIVCEGAFPWSPHLHYPQ